MHLFPNVHTFSNMNNLRKLECTASESRKNLLNFWCVLLRKSGVLYVLLVLVAEVTMMIIHNSILPWEEQLVGVECRDKQNRENEYLLTKGAKDSTGVE